MNHEKHIKRCIELAEESLNRGDNPFGSVIVCGDEIIAEEGNEITENDITNHAEIVAMRKAQKILKTNDLSNCTIYSNCEPCPMCAFMMRELKFKTVVFSLTSKYMGGYSKWNILEDKELERFAPVFSKPPKVIVGILKEEAEKTFRKAGWKMDL